MEVKSRFQVRLRPLDVLGIFNSGGYMEVLEEKELCMKNALGG